MAVGKSALRRAWWNIDMECGELGERRAWLPATRIWPEPGHYDLLHEEIADNLTLAPSQRVKRFAILHKEWTPTPRSREPEAPSRVHQ